MASFIKIGNEYVNLDQVSSADFSTPDMNVFFVMSNGNTIHIPNEESEAILAIVTAHRAKK